MLTSTTSQLTTLTQANHPNKPSQAYTSMPRLTESSQDPEPPSTPKRNNSDITNEEIDFKNKFVSPETSENKRNKLRLGDDPMIEDEELNKNKKPGTTKMNQRLLNLTTQAAAKKKEGAAKPGAPP